MDSKEMAEYTLTTQEAAQIIGVSPSRVRRFVSEGRLTGIMRAGAWFFKPDIVKNFKPKPPGRPAKQ